MFAAIPHFEPQFSPRLTSTVKETRLGVSEAGFYLLSPSVTPPPSLPLRHSPSVTPPPSLPLRRGPAVRRCEKSLPGWLNPTSYRWNFL